MYGLNQPRGLRRGPTLVAAIVLALFAGVAGAACSGDGGSGAADKADEQAGQQGERCVTAPIVPADDGVSYEFPEPVSVGTVQVTGDDLPKLEDSESDSAVGCVAPVIDGHDFEGEHVRIGGQAEEPTLVVIAAHWCPHCNNELPAVVSWADQNSIDDLADLVVISTAATEDGPDFPPASWLETAMGWHRPAMADDSDGQAAEALGVTAYPMFVLLDSDGVVVQRATGRPDLEAVQVQLEEMAGESQP